MEKAEKFQKSLEKASATLIPNSKMIEQKFENHRPISRILMQKPEIEY